MTTQATLLLDTINALQTLHQSIPGITRAPQLEDTPASATDIPFVLTWPETIQFNRESIGNLRRADVVYAVQCLIVPVAQDTMGSGLVSVMGYAQAFLNFYLNPDNLKLIDDRSTGCQSYINALQGASTSDVTPIEYAGIAYRGFTIRLAVVQKW